MQRISTGDQAKDGKASSRPPIPDGATSFVKSGLAHAVQRLEDVVEQETRLLQERKFADLQDFNHRKRHGLLELTRMLKPIEGLVPGEDLKTGLQSLRAKLEKNRSVLQLHLTAIQEISAIIARAIQDAESDGTYSLAIARSGRKP